MKDVSFGW